VVGMLPASATAGEVRGIYWKVGTNSDESSTPHRFLPRPTDATTPEKNPDVLNWRCVA
jgi:hypothetical protein